MPISQLYQWDVHRTSQKLPEWNVGGWPSRTNRTLASTEHFLRACFWHSEGNIESSFGIGILAELRLKLTAG